jgi:hypothetical protein
MLPRAGQFVVVLDHVHVSEAPWSLNGDRCGCRVNPGNQYVTIDPKKVTALNLALRPTTTPWFLLTGRRAYCATRTVPQ